MIIIDYVLMVNRYKRLPLYISLIMLIRKDRLGDSFLLHISIMISLHIDVIVLPKMVNGLLWMINLGWHPKLKDIIISACTLTIHRIWRAKNELRFNNVKTGKYVLLSNITVLTNINSSFLKGWIVDWRQEHHILINFKLREDKEIN